MAEQRRAAIYARISQADAEVDKTDRQELELRELAARSGYEVVEVFVDDDVSAFEGKQARPGFVALLAGVNRGEVDVVMATEPLRYTRGSASELEALQVACTRVGAIIHTRAAGVQDPGTPMIRAMLQFQDTLAWLEVATARERQKVRHRGDRAKGIAKRGTRPFGFETDGMTVRESEAIHIRDAFDSVLDRGATLWEVAQRWNALGVVTDGMGRQRRDRADPGAMKIVPAVWTTTTVRQVLTRPRNAGILTHEGAELPLSQIEPIVTREQLEALKAAIKGTDSLRGPKPQYLLGGLLLCVCGERMHATKSVTARKGKPKEEWREYRIYRCRLYGFDRSQSHVTIAQKIAEEVVRGTTSSRTSGSGRTLLRLSTESDSTRSPSD